MTQKLLFNVKELISSLVKNCFRDQKEKKIMFLYSFNKQRYLIKAVIFVVFL